jgi:hypothetical protein
MLPQSTPEARLTIAASFPTRFFLENLVPRDDNSILVSALLRKELYNLPQPIADGEVKPVLLHTFNEGDSVGCGSTLCLEPHGQ